MKRIGSTWPKRFFRWLLGGPFQRLPPQYGNTVPPELQRFEAEAERGQHQGLGEVARQAAVHHVQTKPARQDDALERQ